MLLEKQVETLLTCADACDSVDIAYSQDGTAMAVWSDYAAGVKKGEYIRWNGTNWYGQNFLPDPDGLTPPQSVFLAASPDSNQMVVLESNDLAGGSRDIFSYIWNGTAWGNNITLETSTNYQTRIFSVVWGNFGPDTPTNLNVYIVPSANLDCDDNIVVHGNYTAAGAHVDGASCNVTFAHAPMGPFAMNDATNDYNYSRTDRLIALTGITTYTIYCSKAGYQSLNTTGSINVTTCTAGEEDGVIPEFNIIGIFLILIIAITGYVIVSKRNLSK